MIAFWGVMSKLTTTLTEYGDIYDAIQTGEIEAKMGDIINGKFIMTNGFHLDHLPDDTPLFIYVEKRRNHSTGFDFEETFIHRDNLKTNHPSHIEVLSLSKKPLSLD